MSAQSLKLLIPPALALVFLGVGVLVTRTGVADPPKPEFDAAPPPPPAPVVRSAVGQPPQLGLKTLVPTLPATGPVRAPGPIAAAVAPPPVQPVVAPPPQTASEEINEAVAPAPPPRQGPIDPQVIHDEFIRDMDAENQRIQQMKRRFQRVHRAGGAGTAVPEAEQ